MRVSFSPLFSDWIVTSLRWIILLGMVIALAIGSPLTPPEMAITLVAILWNASLTTLAALNRRLPAHYYLSVAMDMLVAYLLFYLSRESNGNIAWAGLLPIVSASLYFQIRGVVIVAILNILVQGVLAFFGSPPLGLILFIALLVPLYLGLGLIFHTINYRIKNLWETKQKEQMAVSQAAELANTERRQAIYKLIAALSASLNYQRVLETAMDLSTTALSTPDGSADRMVSAVLLFKESDTNGTELEVGSARRFTASDMHITLPGTSGLIERAISQGTPQLTQDVTKDPELGRIMALRNCQSAYCIPLRTGLDTCGVLLFVHPDADFFVPEHQEILDIVGNQVTIAIENARLYQDLEMEKERMMEIQDETRKKMARDLHDGPTQSVSAIAMRVNFARRLMERDQKAAAEELYKIEDLARHTTKEIRHMLFTLRPLVLESQGLIAALESMADKMRETYNQNVIIQADPSVISELEMGKQAVVFYIAEEAVNNARKHARAVHIWVRLKSLQEDLVLLEIEDNGVGFDMNAVDSSYENRGSLGMVNMRERTELVNGVLQVDSAVGRGTRIQVIIPLTEEAADRIRRGL